MPKTFDVARIADEEAITVKLRNGDELRAADLTPEVVDDLAKIEDKRARESAHEEAAQRQHMRTLQDENAPEEDWGKANTEMIELVSKQSTRARTMSYEQLAIVFRSQDGKPLSVKFLKEQIPLPVAQRISEELTRQILGRKDAEGEPAGSPPDATPAATTT